MFICFILILVIYLHFLYLFHLLIYSRLLLLLSFLTLPVLCISLSSLSISVSFIYSVSFNYSVYLLTLVCVVYDIRPHNQPSTSSFLPSRISLSPSLPAASLYRSLYLSISRSIFVTIHLCGSLFLHSPPLDVSACMKNCLCVSVSLFASLSVGVSVCLSGRVFICWDLFFSLFDISVSLFVCSPYRLMSVSFLFVFVIRSIVCVCLYACLFLCLFVCICLSSDYLSVFFFCLFMFLSVCVSCCLFIRFPSVPVPVCLCVCASCCVMHVTFPLSVCLSVG